MAGFEKNVASQKWLVFAFDATDNTPVTGDAANITAKIRKDYGTATATNDTNPTEIESGYYEFDLTQAETNADVLDLIAVSGTADVQVVAVPGRVFTVAEHFNAMGIESDGHVHGDVKQWLGTAPLAISSQKVQSAPGNVTVGTNTDKAGYSLASTGLDAITQSATGVIEIAKAIWDRVITGANHNVNNSAAKRLREAASTISMRTSIAQAGANQSITLDANASSEDGIYERERVSIIGGTGDGQGRIITNYNGTTKVATVDRAWHVNPDSSSEFALTPADADLATVRGILAQAGSGYLHVRNEDGEKIAEEGADGDTLKTISDEIASLNDPTAAAITTAVLAGIVDGTLDLKTAVKEVRAATVGKAVITGTDPKSIAYRNNADDADVLTHSVPADGSGRTVS